ncbi:BrnA antitoxin family protein [Candidatus Gracilibacteria bacterium]|nr:BrnA antitoxin family protein [Candidatus Gracilibacteria bacterium]
MKKELYTKEELAFFQSLEKDIDSGNYEPMETQKLEKKRKETKKIAENTIRKRTKKKTVNIRLYEDDLEKIKAISLEKGIPYQTLINSAIHKLATKEI